MAFWWVNHKQTHRAEIEGGYIWSPKKRADGATSQTYTNLTLVKPGDVVFSYAWAEIRAVGVATSSYREAPKPSEFGAAGASWDETGWLVPVEWLLVRNALSPKAHLEAIAPMLPAKHSPIQKDTGKGNQACYLAEVSDELGRHLKDLVERENHRLSWQITDLMLTVQGDIAEQAVATTPGIGTTEIDQLIRARRGQGAFKLGVLRVEPRCRVTGLDDPTLLVASHMKPWKDCDNRERLDPFNGLLLSPHVDRLFDRGLISFSDDGRVLVANDDVRDAMRVWHLDPEARIGAFRAEQIAYLRHHRNVVFQNRALAQGI